MSKANVAAVLLALVAVPCFAAEWTRYSDEFNNSYFDADSIMVGARSRMAWMRRVHFDTITLPSGMRFRVERHLVEIDCKAQKLRYVASSYSMSDQALPVSTLLDPEGRWGPIVGGDDTKLARGICSGTQVVADAPKPAVGAALSEAQRQFELWEKKNAEYESDPDGKKAAKHDALRALKRSAELEHPEGLYQWAMQWNWPNVLEAGSPEQQAEEVRLLKRAAELGYVAANVPLGIAYDHGRGVPRDPGRYAYHQCVAARAGDSAAIANLKSSTVGAYADFDRVVLNSPVAFHARPDTKPGGVSFLPSGKEIWLAAQYDDGWSAVYVEDGCSVGYVQTSELSKARRNP